MRDLFSDLDARVREAVRYYWETRAEQGRRQGGEDDKDRGFRRNVTGGGHLDGFANLIGDLMNEAGIPEGWIYFGRGSHEVPGFFRATKGWDMVIVADGTLLALIEFKSQAGPSYGNNYNNRSEEAIGNAEDFWTAYEKEIIPSTRQPWLGYMFLLEEDEDSTRPISVAEPHFDVEPAFKGASYADRYQILCERLLRERLYDSTCFILSERERGFDGQHREPHPDLTFRAFAADLISHLEASVEALGSSGADDEQIDLPSAHDDGS